jgi:omega-6 fatty acid desaturase (delta-12 desaturase)
MRTSDEEVEMNAEERRAGAALIRQSKPFSEEQPSTTWRLWASTCAVWASALAVALFSPWWPVQLIGSVVAGLTIVRMFIFFHDWKHGALFRDSKAGAAMMTAFGWYCLVPPPVWKETHDYHHRNNARMLGASIGSYPTVTTTMWRMMKPSQKRWYRFARNPLTILFGYITLFMGGMCTAAFVRAPKENWQGPAALLLHFALIGAVGWWLGPFAAFAGVILPSFLSCALGAYLFYAQHNFPGIELRDRRTWTYHHAALRCSSMFDMSPVMHWFTGNIGYHHVHHLNHKIPFYRLPETMAAMPELQDPHRTSWRPSDVMACLRLKVWDPASEQLIGWQELEAIQSARKAKAAAAK